MKNILLDNYGLFVNNYSVKPNGFSFYIDYSKYFFIKSLRTEKELSDIYNITKEVNKYHEIVPCNNGKLTVKYNNYEYVLLKIKMPEYTEIELYEILYNQKVANSNYIKYLSRSNWGSLWSEKIDYLEYQISELGKNFKIIIKSFSYYVGLAENAILFFNMVNKNHLQLYYSNRRVYFPNYMFEYYNPLDIIVDYRIRNIGEYIKSKFFEGEQSIDDIEWLINKNILKDEEILLLFSRLLYPSYYFDMVSKIIESDENEEKILKYIQKATDYEAFLRNCYNIFSKKTKLFEISWLTNSHIK